MKKSLFTRTTATMMTTAALILSLSACGQAQTSATSEASSAIQSVSSTQEISNTQASSASTQAASTTETSTTAETTMVTAEATGEDSSETYTDRDLEQTADTSNATKLTVTSGQDIDITQEGVYVVSGTATDVTIRVNVDNTAKVQLVLDGVSIENSDAPAIYVLSADKVFVTTTEGSQNSLAVTGTFVADGETNLDAAIFSKDDLVLNGLGTLNISSTDHAVVSKDDLKVTGGTYTVSCWGDAFQANDEIYVAGGTFNIAAEGDGFQGNVLVQVDGGTMSISAAEGIESTVVRINNGAVDIAATDDGINATDKNADGSTPSIEINGGEVSVTMGQGDTDALDSNGNLYISGGTVNLNGQFAFDFDGAGELTGGTLYVNGEQVTSITNSMMMGGGMGGGRMGAGMQGGMGAGMGGGMRG